MLQNNIGKRYLPPVGSENRFKLKLKSAIDQDRREGAIFKTMIGSLGVIVSFLLFMPLMNPPQVIIDAASFLEIGKSNIKATQISSDFVQYHSSLPGVRLYWILQ